MDGHLRSVVATPNTGFAAARLPLEAPVQNTEETSWGSGVMELDGMVAGPAVASTPMYTLFPVRVSSLNSERVQ